MPCCPVCESIRIVIVVNPERRAFCTRCGARWRQEGSRQRGVKHGALVPLELPKRERQVEPSA